MLPLWGEVAEDEILEFWVLSPFYDLGCYVESIDTYELVRVDVVVVPEFVRAHSGELFFIRAFLCCFFHGFDLRLSIFLRPVRGSRGHVASARRAKGQ